MSQRYIRELCVGHCYAWIWTGVYNSHGGLSLYLHASANLDTYILNLHTQSRSTVCTLHGNMYSSSMCAQLMFVSWYFQILLFFFNKCASLKWPQNSQFWEFNDENECKLKPATRATFCNFFHWNWTFVVQKLWYFEWDTSHSVKILSCICTQNRHQCLLRIKHSI